MGVIFHLMHEPASTLNINTLGKAHRIMPGVPRRRSDYIYYTELVPFVAPLVSVKGLFWGDRKQTGL